MPILPDAINESDLDDIQSVDFTLDALIEKFIMPIERLRSVSAPILTDLSRIRDGVGGIAKIELDNSSVDAIEPQESRTHAFYRMLGLPVISQDFLFYNPGFNPNRSAQAAKQNSLIDERISQTTRLMHTFRENGARARLTIFKKQSIEASLYALVLPIIKPFQTISENINFLDQDNQQFTIPVRKLFLSSKYQNADGSDITSFFDSGTHILRPFSVDPTIARTVIPPNRMICEPFLKDINATKLEKNIQLVRPGIEFILRLRLKQQREEAALQETIFALNDTVSVSDLSLADLRRLALALLNENKINDSEILNLIGRPSNAELQNINNLIKTIKALVDLLVQEVERVDFVAKNIDWIPLPSERGPEFGSLDVGNFIKQKNKVAELDRRIKQLQIKSQNSKRRNITSDKDLGQYAISVFENPEKTFDQELNTTIEQKNEFIRQGSESLRAIELITGEISGLGLIDILAIYTALWVIPTEVLLGLLDENAFQRLYEFNKDLRTAEVEARHNGSNVVGISEAMKKFEDQVINILAFADRLVQLKLGMPQVQEGGSAV